MVKSVHLDIGTKIKKLFLNYFIQKIMLAKNMMLREKML